MARPYVRRQQETAEQPNTAEPVTIIDVAKLDDDDGQKSNDDDDGQGSPQLFDLTSAPTNGMSIWVHGADGQKAAVVWRTSRQFNRNTRAWEPRGRWVHRHVQPPQDIDFEPIGWSVLRD